MSNIKLDRFKVENTTRGKATVLARFDVTFGPMTVKGYELVRVGSKVFVGDPSKSFKGSDGEWKTFRYVAYNGPKGDELQKQVLEIAQAEYGRRNVVSPPSSSSGGYPDDDEGLPF